MKIVEILNKTYTMPLWGVILLIIIPVILFGGKTVEKPVERIVKVESGCEVEKKNIRIYREIIELDNEVFTLTGDFMGDLVYYLYNPREGEIGLDILTYKVNNIADKKQRLFSEIK